MRIVAARSNGYLLRCGIPHGGRIVDRIDAMKVFGAALDEGSFAGAGRKLGKSPAAVSRAIAFLEAHVGAELLHRTTRSIKLSEAGERYAVACRRSCSAADGRRFHGPVSGRECQALFSGSAGKPDR